MEEMSNKSTLIIAEAGVNHNGDMSLAMQLIDAAAEAGADVVKFQTFSAIRQVTAHARKADYQIKVTDSSETQQEMLSRLELTEAMHHQLIAHCKKRNIEFLSTGFDIESVDLLMRLGQQYFKIPSGEITNLPYLRHVGSIGKPVILSTGMATIGEVEDALNVLIDAGTIRSLITILHCNTEYPTSFEDVNLMAMNTMRSAFGVSVGYSDHTLGIEVPIAAVVLGAEVVEKHLTLSRELPGPDHRASLEPFEFKAMVGAIRNIESAMGDGIKQPSPSELKNKSIVRKSLVAKKPIMAGEVFSKENVTVKRPGTGISPMRWDDVMGQLAPRNFLIDELIVL
jgi:N,N'-diacetyllegionaminate synthase